MLKLIKEKDRLYSIYRRMDAANNEYIRCYICGEKIHWKVAELMHYIPRKFNILRYNNVNTKCGCNECNQIKGGNLEEYGKKLIEEYGEDILSWLEEKKTELFFYKKETLLNEIKELKDDIKKISIRQD